MIGKPVDDFVFLTGERFIDFITFMGCAPRIPLSPDESEHYLRITVPVLDSARLFCAPSCRTPACDSCRAPITNWKELLYPSMHGEFSCPACHAELHANTLNVGKRACYSRSVAQISPVFESEAIPSEHLLSALSEQLDTPFRYAFV